MDRLQMLKSLLNPNIAEANSRRQDDLSATILNKFEIINCGIHDSAKITAARLSQLEAKMDVLSVMSESHAAADISSSTPNCSQVSLGHTNSKNFFAPTPLNPSKHELQAIVTADPTEIDGALETSPTKKKNPENPLLNKLCRDGRIWYLATLILP
ncbi:hypothetical protein RF11_09870 [Thelohanellus kitauei]|uniref:Uncharacterized protein n=1 Tax=Thelohanellus kitauei TaxID=669202 RepID=A0A0C2NBA9_THEKT|nr:hypothetical protein RF11_09870 [Thelohanellus kitauei]